MRVSSLGCMLVAALLPVTGCKGTPDPGGKGSASGAFSAAYVDSFLGALRIVLGSGSDVCATRASRTAFETRGDLRIRLFPIDTSGSLTRAEHFYWDEVSAGPGPLAAENAFLAAAVPVGQLAYDVEPPVASQGSLTLDDVPDYDTGRVSGSYEVVIDGATFNGDFDTGYCPTEDGADSKTLADRIYDETSMIFDSPYAPGSGTDTIYRDLERGGVAVGLFNTEADCLLGYLERNKIGAIALYPGLPEENARLCLQAEVSLCFDPSFEMPAYCQ